MLLFLQEFQQRIGSVEKERERVSAEVNKGDASKLGKCGFY